MTKQNKPVIGISMGDFNGIGPEVILKALDNTLICEMCTPVIFGSSKVISFYKKLLESELQFVGIDEPGQIIQGKVNLVHTFRETPNIVPGELSDEAGELAYLSLKEAAKALKNNFIDALVTAPINKKSIQRDGFNFPGQTEFLEHELGGEALMLLSSNDLRIAVATGHISIDKVSEAITDRLIEKRVKQLEASLIKDFAVTRPKIAVLGLDPHSGDGGVIGVKDSGLIAPTVKRLFDEGILVFGPYASDGFFGSGGWRNFDGILAMYHDQGLIPFKTISFDNGVNFTAGLSHVRTSPGHGTAFEIAGKNEAEPQSMLAAIYAAIDIVGNRELYREINSNKLKVHRGGRQNEVDEDIDLSDGDQV